MDHPVPCSSRGLPCVLAARVNVTAAVWLADVLVVVKFCEPVSAEQRQWLQTTRVQMRHITFHVDDDASTALLHDPLAMVGAMVWLLLPQLGTHPSTLCDDSIVNHSSVICKAHCGLADCRRLLSLNPNEILQNTKLLALHSHNQWCAGACRTWARKCGLIL